MRFRLLVSFGVVLVVTGCRHRLSPEDAKMLKGAPLVAYRLLEPEEKVAINMAPRASAS